MSEDDHTSERCPICNDRECKPNLLACFDKSGEGELGVGLVGGPLSCAVVSQGLGPVRKPLISLATDPHAAH